MKVTLDKEYRQRYTLEDLDRAKAVIAYEKENDGMTAKEWAEYAINEATKNTADTVMEILKVTASTARNGRIWEAYGEGTGNFDVWIEATAETYEGFIKVGAYLSDIWKSGAEDYRKHMYIRRAIYN